MKNQNSTPAANTSEVVRDNRETPAPATRNEKQLPVAAQAVISGVQKTWDLLSEKKQNIIASLPKVK